MKIVLRDDVDNLGKKGDIVDVADGYARNFLVPRGPRVEGVGRESRSRPTRCGATATARDRRDREAAQALAAQFEGRTITIKARAGGEGRLFGSVTASDIAEAVQKQTGAEIDRRKLTLDEPLKELGGVDLQVRLHPDVVATVHVEVEAAELTAVRVVTARDRVPGSRAPVRENHTSVICPWRLPRFLSGAGCGQRAISTARRRSRRARCAARSARERDHGRSAVTRLPAAIRVRRHRSADRR